MIWFLYNLVNVVIRMVGRFGGEMLVKKIKFKKTYPSIPDDNERY
jgi:fucose permease